MWVNLWNSDAFLGSSEPPFFSLPEKNTKRKEKKGRAEVRRQKSGKCCPQIIGLNVNVFREFRWL